MFQSLVWEVQDISIQLKKSNKISSIEGGCNKNVDQYHIAALVKDNTPIDFDSNQLIKYLMV